MVPAAFVLLDAFPLSPNGKINRKALPPPEYKAAQDYVAPRTPIEEVVAGIWAEVLRLPQIGVNDEFSALGGDSLLATQVTSRIRKACRVQLSLRALFERPTVAGLAAFIGSSISWRRTVLSTTFPKFCVSEASSTAPCWTKA